MNLSSFAHKTIDIVNEGIIAIDKKGFITIYNRRAKEIFGIMHNEEIEHPSGKLETGDIVIIADNCLGRDDGFLQSEDLEIIGVKPSKLEKGAAFIAVGVFGGEPGSGMLKSVSHSDKRNVLKFNHIIEGHKINAYIDFENKDIMIGVDSMEFPYRYISAVGHMVAVDRKCGKVKFYQSKGYTAKREDVRSILLGGSFMGKGRDAEVLDVIGKSIFEVHPERSNIEEFLRAAQGENIAYENEVREINGRPTRCSLYAVKDGDNTLGAILKVEDITELKTLMSERDSVIASLTVAEERLKQRELRQDSFSEIVGESESIKAVIKLAQKASESDSTVLILGESGTGKSLLAECIHKASKRRAGPFIYVNCASIPENLLESELFGYEAGAFTGAKREGKRGLFEEAAGGTIFLDEIGDISPAIQAKLLHVLQSKSFFRIGGSKLINVDTKIITASNKDLEEEVEKGNFRKDLYYRVNVFPIYIPPLRMRREDIYPLIYRILPKVSQKIGCPEKRISGEAIKLLTEYDWPGNIRELENVLERAVNLSDGDIIFKEHLNIKVSKNIYNRLDISFSATSLQEFIESAERVAIKNAIKAANGNKKEAMKLLGIGKTSFYEKIKKYGI